MPLDNSTRPLSADATAPAHIRFSEDGDVLIVTEKATNIIDSYTIDDDGLANGPRVMPSDAETPFGVYFGKHDLLFVSDDFNDAPGAGALSSYRVADDGSLELISSTIPANQTGACWVLVSHNGRFVYVADTVSSVISLYQTDRGGHITLRGSFPSQIGPTDMEFSRNGRFLYALNPDQIGGGSPGITAYRMNARTGALTPMPGVSGLPASIDGLVVR